MKSQKIKAFQYKTVALYFTIFHNIVKQFILRCYVVNNEEIKYNIVFY